MMTMILIAICVFVMPVVIFVFFLLNRRYGDRPWVPGTLRFFIACLVLLILSAVISVWSRDLTALRIGPFYPAVFLAAGLLFLIVGFYSDMPQKGKKIMAAVLAVLLVGLGLGLRLYQNRYDAVPRVEAGDLPGRYLPCAEDSRTATLTEQSALTLQEDLPVPEP